tara:strand:- start:782 stop:1216 length:435 start_codon:yes stop_codon:yes gene_type:complete
MHFISHRGNLYGPNKKMENKPEYITDAISRGFEVEIDVYFYNNNLWLGHDKPEYKIDISFLKNSKIWCHSKNLGALNYLIDNFKINTFWHQNDDYTITSKGYIWAYPNKVVTKKAILVVENNIKKSEIPKECLGICSDYIANLK